MRQERVREPSRDLHVLRPARVYRGFAPAGAALRHVLAARGRDRSPGIDHRCRAGRDRPAQRARVGAPLAHGPRPQSPRRRARPRMEAEGRVHGTARGERAGHGGEAFVAQVSPERAVSEDPPRLAAALADRYRIERALGRGGMATVYLAHDLKHDRPVALKVLRPEVAAALGPERFLREIAITARLDHPHILTLIDSGEADGFLFYVVPYVRGESLRTKLARERQLPVAEAVRITGQVASALDYAHRQGVIHRDVKPENILLHEGEAMVADFG